MRLDAYLVEHGYFESRTRAAEAIKAGEVLLNGKTAKPSAKVSENDRIKVAEAKFYVSRAARKLEAFLDAYPIPVRGKRALDIGSSTGGFAQMLLERGAASVTCVDVGSDQLHNTVRNDHRVQVFEQTDIRDFRTDKPFELITCDVSFISLLHILDAIDTLAAPDADIVVLFKPQFEVGKEAKRNAKGVVTDAKAIARAQTRFEARLKEKGWRIRAKAPSVLAGKAGNTEWLYWAEK